jgi:hypothetical protein
MPPSDACGSDDNQAMLSFLVVDLFDKHADLQRVP